uniref:Uncharacterized protein n=1 Tax=Tanacetum cinerariifolium TaxID=118510 RepID=A0A6L2K052_TANCI|nr:hypothetical protein [Tanacetum cinerariifolium]
MPPPLTNKPYGKPHIEKQILAFIKTFGYDEDPKAKMTSILTFVVIKLHQPWRAIMSVLNRCLTGKDTIWDCARLSSADYKYYKIKKDESEKDNAEEELEEQHVNPVRSGRGKRYMCSGNLEVNVPMNPKKEVVLKKPRTLIIAYIIVKETISVELAKSVSIENQQHQQRDIMTQLTNPVVQSLLDLLRGSKENRLESMRKERKMIEDFLNLLNDPLVHELMDLLSRPVYTDAHTTSAMANLEGNPEEMFSNDANHQVSSPPATTTHDMKLGSAEAAKIKTTWFNMLLKSNIDQNVDHILRPSTIAVAKKLKELIKKYELTTVDLEGIGLEMLKKQYKNDVDLEYYVDQLKAAVLTEA